MLEPGSALTVGDDSVRDSPAAPWWEDRRIWVGTALLLVTLVPTLAAHAPVRLLLQLVVLGAWFVSPGWVLAYSMAGRGRLGVSWTQAPAWGYLLSSVALLAIWCAGARDLWAVFVAPLGGAALAVPLGRLVRDRLEIPAWTRADTRALLPLLVLVPLIVGWPYARVGSSVPDGQVYRAYFTADFVWAMAAVAEVAKGAVPPVNPFRAGSAMHYYWLAHLFPAAEYRHFGGELALRHVLLVNAVLSGLGFVAFLYGLARQFTTRAWAAASGVAIAVLVTSFEGTAELLKLWWWGQPLSLVQYLNIDAVTRWVYHGMPIDGLQRLLLYQPQHQLGYATGFSALLLAHRARRAGDWRVAASCGLLLGGSLLLSTFSALLLTVVAALYLAVRVLRERAWRAVLPMAVVAGLPLLAAVGVTRLLSYVELGSAPLAIGVNRAAQQAVLPTLGLGLGPLLIVLAVAGALLLASRRDVSSPLTLVASVVGVCAVFYVFVDVRDHQDVYVAWRVGHVLFMLMAGLAALVVSSVGQLAGRARWASIGAMALVIVAALPTPLIDLYNTQDITNFGEAPGFRWTLLLSHDEVAGLQWVRTQTEVEAVVQVDPVARDAETWAYIPAFAERRMAAGLPISMIPLAGYQRATARVARVFDARSGLDAAIECRRSEIDYLFIGPPERRRHPGLEAVLDAEPGLFEKVFESPTVAVYRFRDARHGLAPRRPRR